MSNIYQVGNYYETEYFNTVKEARGFKPGGEEPESVERLDAAEECNRLLDDVEQMERDYNSARAILADLCDIADSEALATGIGKRALEFLAAHPIAAATAGDREGQRGYGV